MALPTTRRASMKRHSPSWSWPSDLAFLSADAAGRLELAGRLDSSLPPFDESRDDADGEPDEDDIPGYSCEVSCTDWYGNSRPIFSEGRIFALTAGELIEGRLEGGRVREIRRLDFLRTPPGR
jgi:hypothetical protein